MAVPSPGIIAAKEEVRVELGGGLRAQSGAHPIDEVARNHGVDGADVDLARVARLDIVLYEGLRAEDDILESLYLLKVMDKRIHFALALCEVHLAVLIPEIVVAHHRIGLLYLTRLALEQLLWQRVEGVVAEPCGAYNDGFCQKVGQLKLGHHVVLRKHPRAVGQLLELLEHAQVLDEVDIAALGYGKLASLHLVRRVGHDVYVAPEAEVLLVVGQEVQVEAFFPIHKHGVFDVETVESYGVLSYRRGERILQKAHLVVVNVHVGEHVLERGCEYVAGLEQVVDARRVLPLHNVLLAVRVFAVYFLRHGLVDRKRQNELSVVLALLHLVAQPRHLLELWRLQLLRRDVVDGQGYLLVLVVLVKVTVVQVGALLRRYDFLHQFHGRIVLPAVLSALGAHRHFFQLARVGLELYVEPPLGLGPDGYRLRLVAHRTERKLPSVMPLYGVIPAQI